jgi:pilus assembly protein CpaC
LDGHLPTNDVDFFVFGTMEERKQYTDYVTSGGGIQGPYGHLISADPAASKK